MVWFNMILPNVGMFMLRGDVAATTTIPACDSHFCVIHDTIMDYVPMKWANSTLLPQQ